MLLLGTYCRKALSCEKNIVCLSFTFSVVLGNIDSPNLNAFMLEIENPVGNHLGFLDGPASFMLTVGEFLNANSYICFSLLHLKDTEYLHVMEFVRV